MCVPVRIRTARPCASGPSEAQGDMLQKVTPGPHVMDRPRLLKWWQRRGARVGAGVLVLLLVVFALFTVSGGGRHLRLERTKLGIATVTRGTFNDFIPLRGRVVPRETIYLD